MSGNNYNMKEQNTLCFRSFNQLKALRVGRKNKISFFHNRLRRTFKIIAESKEHFLLESEIGKRYRVVQRIDPRRSPK